MQKNEKTVINTPHLIKLLYGKNQTMIGASPRKAVAVIILKDMIEFMTRVRDQRESEIICTVVKVNPKSTSIPKNWRKATTV